MELKSRFSELSFNIIMRMISGKRYFGEQVVDIEEAARFRDIIRETFELSGASNPVDYLPFLQWIDYQGLEKRMLKLRRETDGFLQGLIDKHGSTSLSTTSIQGETNKTTMDVLLSLQEAEPEHYTDEIIKGIIVVTLIYEIFPNQQLLLVRLT